MHLIGGTTMNVYIAGGARVRGSNNSEPEARGAIGGRTYASAHDGRYNDERLLLESVK